MINNFYYRLAKTNIQNNRKTYIPYIIAFVWNVAFVYIMHAISMSPDLGNIYGGTNLKLLLVTGNWIICIFSVIFLLYTNSFLIKRRKKEIGVYNILGLGKKHIRRMLFVETVLLYIVGSIVGSMIGIIMNKLIFALLLRLLKFPVPFGFFISWKSLGFVLLLFGGIMLVSLVYNILQITVSKPIELVKGSNVGEKEPKTNWIVGSIGFVSLAIGYWIALSTETAIEAFSRFFPAVLFVMIGTYGIFSAGSILILKALRKNKRFYYKTENFITVSGLLYRMKQNAVGLANICILSTALLITISSTATLYVGIEDVIRGRFPREIVINIDVEKEKDREIAEKIIRGKIREANLPIENEVFYQDTTLYLTGEKDEFSLSEKNASVINDIKENVLLHVVHIDDYNRIENRTIELKENEAIMISPSKDYKYAKLKIDNLTLNIIEERKSMFGEDLQKEIVRSHTIVVKDFKVLEKIQGKRDIEKNKNESRFIVGFDVEGRDESIIGLSNNIHIALKKSEIAKQIYRVENAPANKEAFYVLYGGLFFIGIFVGMLFLMATVLIIYYKQISEGFDDKDRFVMMEKVGLSKKEVKATIRKQIIMVFFLPLIFAILHVSVALPILMKILQMLNLYNWQIFIGAVSITLLIFTLIYGLVYSLTARTYYKIIGN